jgi:hypothetical protein
LTRDTDEGNQENPLSLHKYLYCEADPVNGTDPSGNDGIGDFLVSTIIDSSLDAMPNIISPQEAIYGSAQGGPDVTIPLNNTLQNVKQVYSHWTIPQKLRAATELYNAFNIGHSDRGAENAWDIPYLHYRGESLSPVLMNRTVTYKHNVYYASAVNYVLWGEMHRLIDSTFGTTSLQDAIAVAAIRKAYYFHFGLEETEALGFTFYGYSGILLAKPVPLGIPGNPLPLTIFPWAWYPYHP